MKHRYKTAVLCLTDNGDINSELCVVTKEVELQKGVGFEGTVPCAQTLSLLWQATIGVAPFENPGEPAYAIITKIYKYMTCGPLTLIANRGETKRVINESGGGVHTADKQREMAEWFDKSLANGDSKGQIERAARRYIEQYNRQETTRHLAGELAESFEKGVAG